MGSEAKKYRRDGWTIYTPDDVPLATAHRIPDGNAVVDELNRLASERDDWKAKWIVALDDRDAARDAAALLTTERDRLREALKEVEWGGECECEDGGTAAGCAYCGAPSLGRTHDAGCKVAAALTPTPPSPAVEPCRFEDCTGRT